MREHRRPLDRTLELVGSPGVRETLAVLDGRTEVTFAQIDVKAYPNTERSLRALFAAGAVSTPRPGMWDTVARPDTPFGLTAAGCVLLSGLGALQAWADEFPARSTRRSWYSRLVGRFRTGRP